MQSPCLDSRQPCQLGGSAVRLLRLLNPSSTHGQSESFLVTSTHAYIPSLRCGKTAQITRYLPGGRGRSARKRPKLRGCTDRGAQPCNWQMTQDPSVNGSLEGLQSHGLREAAAFLRLHPTRVFSYQGRPIRQVSTKAWYSALQRAGIADFRWHDLRHTWASWHVQNGTPLHAIQELGGWESSEMVRRYAHVSAEHLAPYASRLCTLRLVTERAVRTNWSQATNLDVASWANSLRKLARPERFELPTPWFVGRLIGICCLVIQQLAALAVLKCGMSPAQSRHIQCELGTPMGKGPSIRCRTQAGSCTATRIDV